MRPVLDREDDDRSFQHTEPTRPACASDLVRSPLRVVTRSSFIRAHGAKVTTS
jgi:hypothetical protein